MTSYHNNRMRSKQEIELKTGLSSLVPSMISRNTSMYTLVEITSRNSLPRTLPRYSLVDLLADCPQYVPIVTRSSPENQYVMSLMKLTNLLGYTAIHQMLGLEGSTRHWETMSVEYFHIVYRTSRMMSILIIS